MKQTKTVDDLLKLFTIIDERNLISLKETAVHCIEKTGESWWRNHRLKTAGRWLRDPYVPRSFLLLRFKWQIININIDKKEYQLKHWQSRK